MEINDCDIANYTLADLDNVAAKLQNELKRAREEVEESTKELTFMQKKQKVVEIKKSQEELAALKQVLSTNCQQIKEIDENIKLLGNYTFLLSHTLAILATRQKI